MMQLVLVVLGVVMSLGSCGVAWSGRHLPVYVATLGPLTLLVAGRRPLAAWAVDTPVRQLAADLEFAAMVADIACGMGVLMVLTCFVCMRYGRWAPALGQVGALTLAFAWVWAAWARANSAIWLAGEESPDALVTLAVAQGELLWQRLVWSGVVLAIVYLPFAIWGLWRERWPGLGDGVAGVLCILLTLRTGAPAREAVDAVHQHVVDHCEPAAGSAGLGLLERHPVIVAATCETRHTTPHERE